MIDDEDCFVEMLDNMTSHKPKSIYEVENFDMNKFFEETIEIDDAFLKNKLKDTKPKNEIELEL